MDEKQVIDELRKGNQRALSEAYGLHSTWLRAYCLASTKSKDDAEDIVQDTFLKLLDHRDTLQPGDTLRPLLLTIARHRLVDTFRKRLRDLRYEDYVEYRDRSVVDGGEHVDFDLYLQYVEKVIGKLPPAQQTIVRMSNFQGMSNEDIAKKLNISKKTVDNQLSSGNHHLKAILKEALKLLILIAGF